jgi:GGDEF domain-containing protein
VIDRRDLLAVGTGLVGFFAAIAGLLEHEAWLGVVAGTCALLAGLCTLDLTDRLRRMTVAHDLLAARSASQEVASNQMAARAARFEAEALKTRTQVAEAMRREAARQAISSERTDGLSTPAVDPITDPVTGLFNEQFFMATLEKRVSAARRGLRPLGLVLMESVTDISSDRPQPCNPTVVAEALVATLREADTVARLDDGRFAVLLEDTPENGCIWTIERVRRRLGESHPGHTVWAGLSCYPSHAFEQEHLIAQARAALVAATEWRQDRIEVAATPED